MTTDIDIIDDPSPILDTAIFKDSGNNVPDVSLPIKDSDWIAKSFLVADDGYKGADSLTLVGRYFSTVQSKHTDTRWGGNFGMNSKPQFTRYSDIRYTGRLAGRVGVSLSDQGGNHGMGRYYSEAIDDNGEYIFLTFGVPQYNSLTNFFSHVFDPDMARLARQGRGSSGFIQGIASSLGTLFGSLFALATFPFITLPVWAFRAVNSFFPSEIGKYYTFKPAMHNYWLAVQTLTNNALVNFGLYAKSLDPYLKSNSSTSVNQGSDASIKAKDDLREYLMDNFPEVFRENGLLDVFALANRALRRELYIQIKGNPSETNKEGDSDTLYLDPIKDTSDASVADNLIKLFKDITLFNDYYGDSNDESGGDVKTSLDSGAKDETQKTSGEINFANQSETEVSSLEFDPRLNQKTGNPLGITEKTNTFKEHFESYIRGASNYAIFKVDSVTSVSESFSNSVGESSISMTLNSVSGTARSTRFSLADGNIVGGPIGDLIGTATEALSSFVGNSLASATLGVSNIFGILMGSGYVDIPKTWENSSVSLPRITYSMKLVSPYGNLFSQLQNIYIPYFMLLAGALPLSTGKNSYASPFLVQCFHQGKNVIRLGIIDSLSINRGITNLAFTNNGKMLSAELSFSIVDLSSIMHMPVSSGALFDGMPDIDPDSVLYDYLATLTGQSIYDQMSVFGRTKQNIAKKMSQVLTRTSPAYWGSLGGDTATNIVPFLPTLFKSSSQFEISNIFGSR